MMRLMSASLLGIATFLPFDSYAEPQRGGLLNVATIGEPPTLDPMASTADLVGMISQHIFETLYTFAADWSVVPLLAQDMPEISEDGLTYTIRLREGMRFHDGEVMVSSDVVASFNRWMEMATRGQQAAQFVDAVSAPDDATVVIQLSEPYAPLLTLLAFNAGPVVMREELITAPLEQIVGTGPYQLQERRPDQYIQLVRFEDYQPRDEEPNGYGGARHQYVDEIRFVPVPDANTRVEGAVSGQFDYVDSIPAESIGRLDSGASEPVILEAFAWPMFIMNSQQGLLSDVRLRRAVVTALNPEDLLIAGFGTSDFYTVNGSLYPEGHVWHTDAGVEIYGTGDPEAAAALLVEAGYDGTAPLRLLASRQYEFHFKMAEIAVEYLRLAGFNVELEVMDWASLTQRRQNPDLWEIFVSHSPFQPDPSMIGIMQDTSPGWWQTEAKAEALSAFNNEADPASRIALFADLQTAFYQDLPLFKVGDFNAAAAISPRLNDVTPAQWPYFWNAYFSE